MCLIYHKVLVFLRLFKRQDLLKMGVAFVILAYLWLLLELIAIIFSVFGNCVVIYVMTVERKLRKKSTLYIISIAIADLLCSVFVIPLAITRIEILRKLKDIIPEIPKVYCIWVLSIVLSLTMASVFQLLFVSVDRYWAICHPTFYLKRTAKFTKCVILLCWIAGFIFGMTPVFTQQTGDECNLHPNLYVLLSNVTVATLVVVIVLYGLIYRTFKIQVNVTMS